MEKTGQKSEIGSSNHVEEEAQSKTPSNGSICGFESLHHLLRASLKPEHYQEVSRLLLGLNCGSALDLLTLPEKTTTLSSNRGFEMPAL